MLRTYSSKPFCLLENPNIWFSFGPNQNLPKSRRLLKHKLDAKPYLLGLIYHLWQSSFSFFLLPIHLVCVWTLTITSWFNFSCCVWWMITNMHVIYWVKPMDCADLTNVKCVGEVCDLTWVSMLFVCDKCWLCRTTYVMVACLLSVLVVCPFFHIFYLLGLKPCPIIIVQIAFISPWPKQEPKWLFYLSLIWAKVLSPTKGPICLFHPLDKYWITSHISIDIQPWNLIEYFIMYRVSGKGKLRTL